MLTLSLSVLPRHFCHCGGLTCPLLKNTRKSIPLQGEQAHSLNFFVLITPISIQIKSKSNPNQIHSFFCSSFFLCLQGQPELCGSYHILQSCFSSSSVSMANLSHLVAASFSSLALLSSSVSFFLLPSPRPT